jgi:surface antigen
MTSGVQGQTGLRSFLGTTAAKMDDADWELLRSAALDVLNDPGANASKSWNNSANDHHGTVTLLKSYDSPDGRPCKRLRLDSVAGGQQGTVSYNVCRSTDGKWRIDS